MNYVTEIDQFLRHWYESKTSGGAILCWTLPSVWGKLNKTRRFGSSVVILIDILHFYCNTTGDANRTPTAQLVATYFTDWATPDHSL